MGAIDVSLGVYELEEPWGRLVEVGRDREQLDDLEASGPITTYVLKDRTTRASSLKCKTVADAVSLARFLEAHLAELRRFLLEQVEGDAARLRALETDVTGAACTATWSFSTGDADPSEATEHAVRALHDGFLARLAPMRIEDAELEPELTGGKAVLAVFGTTTHRIDLQRPSGPAYRDVQLAAVTSLAESLT